ncbi:substrate-binding domain-containing protein [Arundinibacter roseus]|uniref:LacI family DNA-binding transcriptional regulator n=1 Tax=Arundinibacter roseus TaxID=2070510 RepID=A0A4R4JY77_9BACT|nr:substrate-binding domain-containing protein [Arundinibacter roseus]TDB59116.1 LacI family DNA-binding transcriptional regulator [Arundinibacter roseus]
MVSCPQCSGKEGLQRAGFVRGKQRFFCGACRYHFTVQSEILPKKKRHQTTILDIAAFLGISASTVSRALLNRYGISEATRAEVLRVAQELDYQPNLLAQSLSNQETHTIGVIIPDIERPFFASVVSGIQQVASESGYRVMVCQSNESHQVEVANVQALVASRVDGLLICHSTETTTFEHIRLQHRKGIPIVHFDRVCEDIDTSKVVQDDFGGGAAVATHLIQEGHRRFAILAGPENLLISRHRVDGFLHVLKQEGIAPEEVMICHSQFKPAEALHALHSWRTLPQPPEAVFCVHYGNAIDMMMEMKKNGGQIPQELAFAGFGEDKLAAVIEPGLTTVHQHPIEIGRQAALLFLEQILAADDFVPITRQIRGELIVRQSSVRKR